MGRLTRLLGLDSAAIDAVRDDVIKRDVEPLEGTNMSLWNSQIPFWWAENGLLPGQQMFVPGDGHLAERVWVANRCIQMNAQQIAAMPLRYEGTQEPAWLSSPDPNWFPNGVSDAIFSIVAQMYGWGFACLYVTDRYATGYPRYWTVLPSSRVAVKVEDGARTYKIGETPLDPADIIQIDRNPGFNMGAAAHGTSALRAYAQQAWGLLAAGNQSMNVSTGGIPLAVLKSQRKLTAEQATALQEQWMSATMRRNGAPPVLPPEIEFEALSFNPSELALLETQDFNLRAIATAFGVPAVLLNTAIRWGMTYQSPGALGEMWWRFELRPTAKRIADAFTAQLLPAGQWVWFDAADTFLALDPSSETDDPQASAVAKASPMQQPAAAAGLTVIGGNK